MLLILFGIGMLSIGGIMLVRPLAFSNAIVDFANKPWFHPFEIASRLLIGILFLLLSDKASYPLLFLSLGIILCFVSIFLLVIGPGRHKRFAMLASRIGKFFRPIGVFAVFLGGVLVYLGSA